MTDDTTITLLHQPGSVIDPLTEIAREGARPMLAAALKAEAAGFVAQFSDELLPDGRQRIVRHGTGPERAIQTGIGPIRVQRQKVRDRAIDVPNEKRIRFTSNILPKWARRSKSLDALLPVLLALWSPSGSPEGLRLGLRDGYLNFYSRGQSIARVIASDGEPELHVHWKYVSSRQPDTSNYVHVPARGGYHWTDGPCVWGGQRMLNDWIARSTGHRSAEKTGVERVIAANPAVIDIEAAVPTDGVREGQLRMDLVALERNGPTIRLVFWEAKRTGSKELRSATGEPPILVRQLRDYEAFLTQNAAFVAEAYRRACKLITTIHAMAGPDKPALDPLILEAAQPGSPLEVDPLPRIVLFEEGQRRQAEAWLPHLARLRARATVVVCPIDGSFSLAAGRAAA